LKRRRLEISVEMFTRGSLQHMTYAEAAEKLETTEGTLKSWVRRLNERNQEILREVVAQTVASPDEVAGELRELLASLSPS